MTPAYQIHEVNDRAEIPIIRELFQEYADWLGVDLCFQGFEEELNSLPCPYERPRGVIYLATVGQENAGCIALKPLPDGACEMKRLYVRPQFRGLGIAKSLVSTLLHEARKLGYPKMKLDTLGRMQPAIALYESFGFQRCGGYYDNPIEDVVYMELGL